MQATSRVSRLQAKFLFDRDHPNFLRGTYSQALLTPQPAILPTLVAAPSSKGKRPLVSSPTRGPSDVTEVVCMSPAGNHIYTAAVPLATATPREADLEGTSECNPALRREAHRIYCDGVSTENTDRAIYEAELQRQSRRKRKPSPLSRDPVRPQSKRTHTSTAPHRPSSEKRMKRAARRRSSSPTTSK